MTDSAEGQAPQQTPNEALQSAAEAIKRLDEAPESNKSATAGPKLVVLVVCVLAVNDQTTDTRRYIVQIDAGSKAAGLAKDHEAFSF